MSAEEQHITASSSTGIESNEEECAWCLAEQGMTPQSGSHGICQKHARQIEEQSQQRRDRRRSRSTS